MGLEWDVEFLKTIIKTIVRDHRQELRKTKREYSNMTLAADFIYNAMSYAVVNNCDQVSQKELLSTFKNWNYNPFNMKLDTINTIFDERSISYSKHPLGVNSNRKKSSYQKIIQFPKRISKSE